MKEIVTSKRFRLNLNDWQKALLIAILAPIVMAVQEALQAGSWDIDWKKAGMAGVAAGLVYLLKNFFTPQQVVKQIEEKKKSDG